MHFIAKQPLQYMTIESHRIMYLVVINIINISVKDNIISILNLCKFRNIFSSRKNNYDMKFINKYFPSCHFYYEELLSLKMLIYFANSFMRSFLSAKQRTIEFVKNKQQETNNIRRNAWE